MGLPTATRIMLLARRRSAACTQARPGAAAPGPLWSGEIVPHGTLGNVVSMRDERVVSDVYLNTAADQGAPRRTFPGKQHAGETAAKETCVCEGGRGHLGGRSHLGSLPCS